jgi:GT2 family glycosyltransferase
MRINQHFDIFCFPKVVFFHDANSGNGTSLNWKSYYGERNQLFTYKKYLNSFKFKLWLFRSKLRRIKYFLIDKKHYHIIKDAFNDFKQNKLGVSPKYKPGSLI